MYTTFSFTFNISSGLKLHSLIHIINKLIKIKPFFTTIIIKLLIHQAIKNTCRTFISILTISYNQHGRIVYKLLRAHKQSFFRCVLFKKKHSMPQRNVFVLILCTEFDQMEDSILLEIYFWSFKRNEITGYETKLYRTCKDSGTVTKNNKVSPTQQFTCIE